MAQIGPHDSKNRFLFLYQMEKRGSELRPEPFFHLSQKQNIYAFISQDFSVLMLSPIDNTLPTSRRSRAVRLDTASR